MGRHGIDVDGEYREIFDRVSRALENPRKVGFARALVKSTTSAHLLSRDGSVLGAVPMIKVDNVRFDRVMSKILRGLRYIETGKHLAEDHRVRTVLVDALAQSGLADEILPFASYLASGGRRFVGSSFGYIRRPAPDGSDGELWQLLFFKRVSVLGIIIQSKQGSVASGVPGDLLRC